MLPFSLFEGMGICSRENLVFFTNALYFGSKGRSSVSHAEAWNSQPPPTTPLGLSPIDVIDVGRLLSPLFAKLLRCCRGVRNTGLLFELLSQVASPLVSQHGVATVFHTASPSLFVVLKKCSASNATKSSSNHQMSPRLHVSSGMDQNLPCQVPSVAF